MAAAYRRFDIKSSEDVRYMDYMLERVIDIWEDENAFSSESTQIDEDLLTDSPSLEDKLYKLERKVSKIQSEITTAQQLRKARIEIIEKSSEDFSDQIENLDIELNDIYIKQVTNTDKSEAKELDSLPRIGTMTEKITKLWIQQQEYIKMQSMSLPILRSRYEKIENSRETIEARIENLFVNLRPMLQSIVDENERYLEENKESIAEIETDLRNFVKKYKDDLSTWFRKNMTKTDRVVEKLGIVTGSTGRRLTSFLFTF